MTHFTTVVMLPTDTCPHEAEHLASTALEPYRETEEWFADGSRWDWWIVGGRWDGAMRGLDRLAVFEVCSLCAGTGLRPDGLERFGPDWVEQMNGCNGCQGQGVRSQFRSDVWNTVARNFCPMAEIASDFMPASFIGPDGAWQEDARMGWWGLAIEDEEGRGPDDKRGPYEELWALMRTQYPDHMALSIDCHI